MVAEQQHEKSRQARAPAMDYLFLSGVLALDVVNTEVIVGGKRYDLFSTPEDVARWWEEALTHYPDEASGKAETQALAWNLPLLERIERVRAALRALSTKLLSHE